MKPLLLFVLLLAGTTACAQNEVPKPESAPEEILVRVSQPPEFPGLKQYIVEHLVYPKAAAEKGIEGKCYAQFTVTETGDLTDIKIMRGVPDCPECDAEAIRLLETMPKWKPALSPEGQPEKARYNQPIVFKPKI